MEVSATVTPGKIFGSTEVVTISELNKLGSPTVDIAGAIGTLILSDGSVTNAKVQAGAGVQLDKLETGTDAQVIVANSSGDGAWVDLSGDVTIDNAGVTAIGDDKVTAAMLADNAAVPPGAMMQYCGMNTTTSPTGWLWCSGTDVSRDTYAALFVAIGDTYGVGDGSTTFSLPDMIGRVAVGIDTAGARITEYNQITQSGGADKHTLTTAELPAHNHANGDYKYLLRQTDYNTAGSVGYTAGEPDVVTVGEVASVGDSDAHNILQPYLIVNWMIKT